MIFRRSLSKKKGAAYSFFSGLSAAFIPAVLMLLLQTLAMAVLPLIEFIDRDFGSTYASLEMESYRSKDVFKFFTYGLYDTTELYMIFALLGILSIFVAVRLFSFICDKKTVNVFYSLGIKRSSLFISKYFAGAVLLIAANIVPVILSYVVNVIFLGPSWQLSLVLFHIYCGLSVFSLICFSVAAVVFSSVGTVSEAVVYSVALLFAPTIIIFITEQIIGAFLPSSTYNVYLSHFTDTQHDWNPSYSLLDATSSYNPLLFFADELQQFSRGTLENGKIILTGPSDDVAWHIPNIFVSIPWFLISLLLGGIGAMLFKRIKAENCGFLNTNKILSNLTIFELCLVGSSIMLSEIEWTATYVVIGVGIFAAFVLYIIAETFLKRNFIRILKSLYKFVIHMVVIAIIFGICATGGFGYSTYIPDKAKIESVEISVPLSYSQITTNNSDFGYSSDGFIHVYEPFRYTFMPVMTDSEDINKVMELNREINSIEKDDGTHSSVIIRYNYKDGGYSERKHTLTSKEEVSKLFSLFETKAYKEELKKLFYDFGGVEAIKSEADRYSYVDESSFKRLAFDYDYSNIIARTPTLQENRTLDLTKEQFTAIKDAVYKDLTEQNVNDYFTAQSKQIGVLSFAITEKAYQIEGVNGYSSNNTVIEEGFTSVAPNIENTQPDNITTEDELFTEPEEDILPEEPSPYTDENNTPYSGLGGTEYDCTYDIIITENMKNTLAALKEFGFENCFVSELTIESVSFREYDTDKIFYYYSFSDRDFVQEFFSYPTSGDFYGNPADANNNFEDQQAENKITDSEKIKELDSLMKLHEYTYNSGYFCLIKYSDDMYQVKYLSEEDAPDYVRNYNYVMTEVMYY